MNGSEPKKRSFLPAAADREEKAERKGFKENKGKAVEAGGTPERSVISISVTA